jgi:arylsulfatase A-like enzyme
MAGSKSIRWTSSRGWLLLSLLAAVVSVIVVASRRESFEPASLTPNGPRAAAFRTTPNIDRLAKSSMLFERHFVQFALTKGSTASLFTSQHVDTHLSLGDRQLLEGTFTMAKGLENIGLRTVLFSSNPNASPGMGIGLDFEETFDQGDVEPLVYGVDQLTSPDALLALIGPWLERNKRRRFFAYIHFDPPHQPYIQPDWMTALFEGERPPNFRRGSYEFPVEDERTQRHVPHPPWPEWLNLYDANLRYADHAVGELARLLREAGILDRTLLIVTADHGEAFGEHGYIWHGDAAYEEMVHVPLLVRLPGGELSGRITALTQAIDILPTIFDLLGASYPRAGPQGRSLLPLMAGLEDRAHDYIFTRSRGKPPSYVVQSPEWSLMLWRHGEWRALYDLEADPRQLNNVIDQHSEVAEEMLAAFEEFASQQRRPPVEFLDPEAKPLSMPEAEKTEITPEVVPRLKALGYLD